MHPNGFWHTEGTVYAVWIGQIEKGREEALAVPEKRLQRTREAYCNHVCIEDERLYWECLDCGYRHVRTAEEQEADRCLFEHKGISYAVWIPRSAFGMFEKVKHETMN